tara:strand:- start:1273 stop:1566 length:294 start_codon:yes stop_codon:yes gene_type:complete
MIVSIKNGPHGSLAVITDKEILGKTYSEGKIQLDFTKDFYQGEEKNIEEVKKVMSEAQHLHLSGEKSVALGVELNLVDQERILYVKGIPHAEVVIEG